MRPKKDIISLERPSVLLVILDVNPVFTSSRFTLARW